MSEFYEGRQFIGMDLHRRRSVLVRMSESGQHLETVRILNDRDSLADVMSRAGECPEVKLAFPRPVSSVTICGHSVGGALATLLALDVAANTVFNDPAVYTYGSPRTGDSLLASTYDRSRTRIGSQIASTSSQHCLLPTTMSMCSILMS